MTTTVTDLEAGRQTSAKAVRMTRGTNPADRAYQAVVTGLALLLPASLLALIVELATNAWPSIQRFGWDFVTNSTWDPVADVYGAGPLIFGTLASSFVALLLAVPLAFSVAIFLNEFAPRWLRRPLGFLVELLAAVPSVVYGLWGIFVLIPFLRAVVVPPLKATLGWLPFFQGVFYGNSMLAGGVILAIMVVPYIAAVSREVLSAVPSSQREAALALISPVEDEVRTRLASWYFGTDDETVQRIIFAELQTRGWTIGTAESMTGGMVAAALTSEPGASRYVKGGMVAYDRELKARLLGVSDINAVVNAETAMEMAVGGRKLLNADVAVAVTGSAGPDPQERPPGTVIVAVATPEDVQARELRMPGDRERVRVYGTTSALHLTRLAISGRWWSP